MKSDEQLTESEYTWNDCIIIKNHAPARFHPGELAVVCGMTKIECEEGAKKYHSKIGDWAYTVEFGNGSDIVVAGCFLEKYQPPNSSDYKFWEKDD